MRDSPSADAPDLASRDVPRTVQAAGDALGAFVPGPRARIAGSATGPLEGIRIAVKDLLDVEGSRTGAGNPDFLADAPIAARSAPAVRALLEAGARLVGKTISDELAFSLSGTNVHYGTPVNTAAPGRVPGGSSSGSASAVAGGAAELAIGTDTAGSVRVPASYCGIFGLRPTHGRISTEGVVPLAPSFDTVGLFAADPRVLERGWHALARGAPGPIPPGEEDLDEPMAPPTTLVCPPELVGLLDSDARAGFERAAREIARTLGCDLVVRALIEPGDLGRVLEAFRTIQMAEAWGSHGAWIERRRPRLGPGIAARFAASSLVTRRDADALRPVLAEVRGALRASLARDEIVVQPSASGAAPEITLEGPAKDDLRLRTLSLTVLAGAAGAPVVSVPAGTVHGLPLGVALVSVPGDDARLVACAARLPRAATVRDAPGASPRNG
ncbi:MAG TPA: amidase [Acidimicrobiales bacterium]|nr:amidase [Acidimicrobiales bacterium]